MESHVHLNLPEIPNRFGSSEALCGFFEKQGISWAIGFYPTAPEGAPANPMAVSARTTLTNARSRVVPLLFPQQGQLAQGAYTEAYLRSQLQPQGPFRGVGEIPLFFPALQATTFESPQMQAIFQVAHETKSIVMIHPSGDPIGRPTALAEIEPAIQKYPNAVFIFHGAGYRTFDLIDPLMAKYPNVYFTLDAAVWLFSESLGYNLLGPEAYGAGPGSAQRFSNDFNAVGYERILEAALRESLPRLTKYPDRVMWGTDINNAWHFDDAAMELVVRFSRDLIARLPRELQEPYAFRNADRVFAPYLRDSR